jgi:hypothetical protein
MRKLTKLMAFAMVLVTLMTSLTATPVYAASQIQKGTTRVVLMNSELSNCEDEVVYNGHRYLPAAYYVGFSIANTGLTVSDAKYNYNNGSFTVYFTYGGYVSFWGGSQKIRVLDTDYYLQYPAVLYDGVMYVSAEDIASTVDCSYGFDASKNTMYFYF